MEKIFPDSETDVELKLKITPLTLDIQWINQIQLLDDETNSAIVLPLTEKISADHNRNNMQKVWPPLLI